MNNDTNSGEMKVVFKTAFSGYRKEDVNSYIQSENRRFFEVEKSYKETIDKLEWELENAKSEIERLNGTLDKYIIEKSELGALLDESKSSLSDTLVQLEEKNKETNALAVSLEESRNAINELTRRFEDSKKRSDNSAADTLALREKLESVTEKNSELEVETAKLKNALDAADEKNEVLQDKNLALDSALNSAKEEILQLKEKLEGATTRQGERDRTSVDDLLYRAKNATEDMLRRAEAGAGVILDRARKEALDYRVEIFTAAKDIFTAATEELRRSIGICMSDFVSGIRTAKNDSGRAAEEADRCDDELGRRIERMQNDLDRAIAEKLAEFDRKHGGGK